MDRLTTNEPHDNLSAMLNFAYAKDRRVVLSYAASEDNIDLAEYISLQALRNGCDVSSENVLEGGCMECDCPVAILNAVAIQAAELRGRLKMIEDILGDTYDLDRLRDLVKAEQEGRLIIPPIYPGEGVYWVLSDDMVPYGYYVTDAEVVTDCGTQGFYLTSNRDGSMCDCPNFVPWDELGKSVFRSREEAEAALAKMKGGSK